MLTKLLGIDPHTNELKYEMGKGVAQFMWLPSSLRYILPSQEVIRGSTLTLLCICISAAFVLFQFDTCKLNPIIYLFFHFSEKYFDMNKKHARDALDLYKKFLIRMDRVADFLKVAEVRIL